MSYRSAPGRTPTEPVTGTYHSGGYRGQPNYRTPGQRPPAQTPGVGTDAQNDAFATLKSLLDQYGLGSLADWAWQQLLENHSPNQILLDLYNQPEFKARFPGIEERQKKGLPPISPGEYIAYENAAGQIMRAAGFPPGFYDHPDDFTSFISNNVSVAEVSQRASLYQQAAYQAPPEVRQQLRDLYGITEGHIAAYLADPDRALPLIQQQYQAATIGGEATLQHFGPLSQSEAERLAALGVTDQQAAQGFGQVAHAAELFQSLPGEQDAPGRKTALGVVAGDQAAIDEVTRQGEKRKAQFQSGGSFATGKNGFSGLGSASTN